MKIAAGKIDSFVQQPPASLRIALVFGPDNGAIKLRADQIAKHIVPTLDDPFRVTILTSESVNSDSTRLYDEMAAQALGGGRRLIRMPQTEEKIAPLLTQLLQDIPPTDTLLLLEAGELDKRSKLRTLAESDNPLIAGIACYPEEGADRTRLISSRLREIGHKIEPDALELLATIAPSDRLALFSEIEKLTLYAGSTETILCETVQAALGDAAAVDMDSMVMAIGNGDRATLDCTLRRLSAEATSPIAQLRSVQRHFTRLLETRVRIESGQTVQESMKKLYPPVFWKVQSQFARQVQKWSHTKILRALAALVEAEAQCKRSGIPDQILCQQLFVTLARAA